MTTVPGWFLRQDQKLFRWFLEEQDRRRMIGDLAELGAYMGKSAIVIGEYVRPDETFTVIDLFESPAPDLANVTENISTYPSLTQRAFESNYLAVHDRLPVIVKAPSSEILHHAAADAHRFVHVDASHLYDHVQSDIVSARALLQPSGIVVFDDIQSAHTPGVAAAVWAAVDNGGLHPIVISQGKLYGIWENAQTWQQGLLEWLQLPSVGLRHEVQQVAGAALIRVWQPADTSLARAAWRSLVPRGVRSYRENRRLARL